MASYNIVPPSSQADQDFCNIVHTQVNEMELVRNKIYQIETTHRQMKAQYAYMLDINRVIKLIRAGTRKRLLVFTASSRREGHLLRASTVVRRNHRLLALGMALRICSKGSWLAADRAAVLRLLLRSSKDSQACQATCKLKDHLV